MEEKWNFINRKGYLKIHIAVNIKTKEILALEVTDEKVHASNRMLKKLVNDVLDDRGIMIVPTLADDAPQDTNTNFQFLEQKELLREIR